jgi:hypothetical protein
MLAVSLCGMGSLFLFCRDFASSALYCGTVLGTIGVEATSVRAIHLGALGVVSECVGDVGVGAVAVGAVGVGAVGVAAEGVGAVAIGDLG